MNKHAAAQLLEWYAENGIDEAWAEEPHDFLKAPEPEKAPPAPPQSLTQQSLAPKEPADKPFLGAYEAAQESARLAKEAQTLDELQQAIANFEGISIKKTATNMVFADGNPKADLMIIGEAPGADEDRQGKPFVGVSGQLLDKILAAIGLSRTEEDPQNSVYISNILNWRPPGNRTPSEGEIQTSLPFIKRHIELIQPKIIILSGGVAGKSLLNSPASISKLRQVWHELQWDGLESAIPTLATYHPSYLLRTPSQKKLVWDDMMMLNEKRREIGHSV